MEQNYDQLDIVMPCYNPDNNLKDSLSANVAQLRAIYPGKKIHFIIANDGSIRNFGDSERTAITAAITDLEIVDLPRNTGKGAAVRAGIAASKASHTIYTDIDMPYSISTMKEVIDKVYDGFDIVIAVRNKSYYSKLSPIRKLMSHGSKLLNRLFLQIEHTDTQGGLKGLSAKAKEVMLRTKIDDFLFDTEFIALASRDKSISITDVESVLRNDVELSKMSHKVLLRELRNFYRILFRL